MNVALRVVDAVLPLASAFETVPSPTDRLPPSLLLHFDASVHYADDNATPTSAAVGFVVGDGRQTFVERSLPVRTFVSSAHLEYRALLEAVRAVERFDDPVASLHVHGDAADVIRAVDPRTDVTPGDSVMRRRTTAIQSAVADVPTVTYRTVKRGQNTRAHELARRGHDNSP